MINTNITKEGPQRPPTLIKIAAKISHQLLPWFVRIHDQPLVLEAIGDSL